MLKARSTRSGILAEDTRQELEWWESHCETNSLIYSPPPTHYLTTDASDTGWGAKLNNQSLQGTWSPNQQRLHCNSKEMTAIINVLRDQAQHLSSKSLPIQCDNRTVVSYLRHKGETKSGALMRLTRTAFQILDQFRIHMTIHHIPGNYNCDADRLSRKKPSPEWHLLPRITQKIFTKWGEPAVDLFASQRAHVVQKYCTLDRKDSNATYYDAFSWEWSFHLAWVFPPPHLIPRVLAHLNNAEGTFLLIVPRWKNTFWRPDLKNRVLAPPFTIKDLNAVLIDITTGLPPPKASEMTLEVWKCHGEANT
ncbi:uncharacterized protein LOC135086399 [Ostrinia nubilalis]|uniref:uncharacterized protein LOC135086399 n=1 Tax=Ostrinia nubilalis TaxID=29057 RepID=UPI0030825517